MPGTYAKLVPTEETKKRIAQVVNLLNITNPVSTNSLHVTVVYSRAQCDEIKDLNLVLPIKAHGDSFKKFHQQDGTDCLVLKLNSNAIQDIHWTAREQYGATHDFPQFQPHITLSYDHPHAAPNDSLIQYFNNLTFDQYHVEPLDLEWSSS
jgi:2'-5' RNA ligase